MPARRQTIVGSATLFCGGLVVAALALRLLTIQHVDHRRHLEAREAQSRLRLEEMPVRGRILDRCGNELALSRMQVKSLFAMPHKVVDPRALAESLAPALSMQAGALEKLLSKDRKFVWVRRKLGHAAYQEVRRIGHPALGFRDEPKRFYPKGRIASHVVGFVGMDNHGLEGVEASFDRELRGSPGFRWYVKDAFQKMLALPDYPDRPAVDGNDVWLTLDLYVQDVVEKELRAAAEAWAPLSACCIVMQPRSGEVLALANWPDYLPARPNEGKPSDRRNRAVTDPYEPGSTFKPFAVAEALALGAVTPETEINCHHGARTFRQGRVRRTLHDYHPYGTLTVRDVVAKSSNIGTVNIALRIPQETYLRSLADLDVEGLTGIELPGEAGGWMAPKGWSFYSRTSVPWGQEIAMTPLKLLVCFNALVNGGELMKPSLLRMVRSPEGEVLRTFAPERVRTLVPAEVSQQMRAIFRHTVEKGSGRRAAVEGYTVGGKTGTKTKVSPEGYSNKRSVTSFVCCAPADDPVVSLLVVLDEPSRGASAHYLTGGKVSAPVAGAILRRILPYLGVEKAGGNRE